jgi:hypothetical protein
MSTPPFGREDFDQVLREHQQLIDLANQLELRVYLLGEAAPGSPTVACQKVAGALIGALRTHLFRQDQQVLPVLEGLLEKPS